jgi:hypothetical protein
MASVALPPGAGDYLLTLDGAKRWDVVAAQPNASQCIVVLVVRRAY